MSAPESTVKKRKAADDSYALGRNLLKHAADCGNLELMQAVLSDLMQLREADDAIDAFEPDHLSALKLNLLKYAAEFGRLELMKSLLSDPNEPVNINHQWEEDGKSATALWYAASKGHASVVSVLLDHGATQDFTMLDKNSPFLAAIWGDQFEVLECMLNRTPGLVHAELHKNLYDFVNGTYKYFNYLNGGDSVLHLAVALRSMKCVKRLLQYGADPEKMNAAGETPARVALVECKQAGNPADVFAMFSWLNPRLASRLKDNLLRPKVVGSDVVPVMTVPRK